MKRMFFLDNLRASIILLVVVFHIAMGYTTWNLPWWVNDSLHHPVFDLFILAVDVFIMPVMFLLAGYFSPGILSKKGPRIFWQSKLHRIVLPWLGGVLFIAPLIAYSAIFNHTSNPPNYFSFWRQDFWGPYYQQAHYWFLEILALFFLLLTFSYKLFPACLDKKAEKRAPSCMFFLVFALLCAIPFFIGNLFFFADAWITIKYLIFIQPVRIILYLCYFILGVHAWKQDWFTPNGYNPRLPGWLTSAVIMLVVFLFYRVTFTLSPNISVLAKAGHALVFSTFSLTSVFALLALFRRYFDSNAYLWRRLAANSYVIYFIHQCVVIPLVSITQTLQINIFLKYIAVSLTALVLCYVLSEYIISPLVAPSQRKNNSIKA